MDNPQQYQPLSHALGPRLMQPQYEEEEEGDDEGIEQLERGDDGDEHAGPSTLPRHTTCAMPTGEGQDDRPPSDHQQLGAPSAPDEPKRRPGRPRGSKNRRPRGSDPQRPPTGQHGFYQYSVPPAPGESHPHNQQYYEFQRRVLKLCANFYGAAEELVKATPYPVIAQCYQMGPNVKVDPLTMLNDAKKVCDTLLASPTRLTAHPPPPPFTYIQGYPSAVSPQQPQPTPPPSANGKTTPVAQATAPVITNPQSFVVSMGQHPPTSQFLPNLYANPTYPTVPYYGYSPSQPGPSTSNTTPPPLMNTIGSAGNQGAWSEEETEKLKKLAEEFRNNSGDIGWDSLCEKWGNSRTRHQILIKATSLGLKESSSRGTKRRRDTDSQVTSDRQPLGSFSPGVANSAPPLGPGAPPPQSTQPTQSAQPAMLSPASSTPAPSTHPSPAIRPAHAQHRQPSHSQPPLPHEQSSPRQPQHRFPYPMPQVAGQSPIIQSTQYLYQSNGRRDP